MDSHHEKLDEMISLLNKMVVTRDDYYKSHSEEHEYLRVMIEEHRQRRQTWEAIYNRVASGAIWSVIVAMFSAIGFTLKSWITGAS